MRGFIDYWNGDGRLGAHQRRAARRRCSRCLEPGLRRFPRGDVRGRRTWPIWRGSIVPTLAVMGLESPTPSLRVTELVAGAMPRATLRIVPDAGHMAAADGSARRRPDDRSALIAADRRGRRRGDRGLTRAPGRGGSRRPTRSAPPWRRPQPLPRGVQIRPVAHHLGTGRRAAQPRPRQRRHNPAAAAAGIPRAHRGHAPATRADRRHDKAGSRRHGRWRRGEDGSSCKALVGLLLTLALL